MTIFAVLMPTPQPKLKQRIEAEFADDHYPLNETQFLISSTGTAVELSAKLGIVDKKNPGQHTGNAVVFATTSYFGRAPTPVWDWVKAKLEGSPIG